MIFICFGRYVGNARHTHFQVAPLYLVQELGRKGHEDIPMRATERGIGTALKEEFCSPQKEKMTEALLVAANTSVRNDW